MDCPRCKTEIGSARYCGCGWRGRPRIADNAKDFHADAFIQCAHETCRFPAFSKIKTKTGWANLCQQHYDWHFRDEAHANLDRWGMERGADETMAEHTSRMREFVRNGFKGIGRKTVLVHKAAA